MLDYDVNEDTLLSFYNISTIRPTSKNDLHQSTTFNIDTVDNLTTEDQFQILDSIVNRKAKLDLDIEFADVEDPLAGRGSNIVPVLVERGLIKSTNDPEVNSYLISSKEFSSQQYLTSFHADSSIEQLTGYLRYLEKSIKSQQQDVQGLVNSNYENYINCKESIDKVLINFKQEKNKSQKDIAKSKVFLPSKSTSKDELSAELEDSVKNLNTTLALMIRPIQENSSREAKLSKLIEFIKANDFLFNLPKTLIANIGEKNHDIIIEDYSRYLHEKSRIINVKIPSYDEALQQATDEREIKAIRDEKLLIATVCNRLFQSVEKIVGEYRDRIYKHLHDLEHDVASKNKSASANSKFITLVDQIYQLDPNKLQNPIADFLSGQVTKIQDELEYQLTKFDDKFRMMQRKLTDYVVSIGDSRKNGSHVHYIADKYYHIETYIHSSANPLSEVEKDKIIVDSFSSSDNLDLSIINETWLVLLNFITYLEDNFGQSLARFVTNYNHYGVEFNVDPDGLIRQKFDALVNRTIDILILLFEDDSQGATPIENVPANFRQFLPHYTNSLSAIYYLSPIMNKVNHLLNGLGEAVGSVGNLSKSTESNKMVKSLRLCSSKINQRIIDAICCVWLNDCSQIYDLETWEISDIETGGPEHQNDGAACTKLMNILEYFHGFVLSTIHKLIFIKDFPSSEIRIIAQHPSKRTLVSIEIQFIRSLNTTLDSIMKKYNLDRRESNRESDVYKILTMNNFDDLSQSIFPALIRKFDRYFSKDLEKQNLQIFVTIDNASRVIFEDIINKQKLKNSQKVITFFEAHQVSNTLKVDGFIYDILMEFVKLIHVVKPITGNEIFVNMINELQQGVLKSILDNLRANSHLSILDLVNLKLDVNFFMEIFEYSKTLKINEASFRVIEILLNELEGRLTETGYVNNEQDKAEFERIFNENLQVSKNQFDCF